MLLCPRIVATCAAIAAVMPPATAQEMREGYSCGAQAFEQIAGIHARGFGEVRLRLDSDYQLEDASFSYTVRDPAAGLGRMSSTWSMPGERLDESARMLFWAMPLRMQLVDGDYRLTVTTSDGIVLQREVNTADETIFDRDREGRVIRLEDRGGGWMPDLRTSRILTVNLSTPDNQIVFADTILLPDWSAESRSIRSARRRAERARRNRACSRSFSFPASRAS